MYKLPFIFFWMTVFRQAMIDINLHLDNNNKKSMDINYNLVLDTINHI